MNSPASSQPAPAQPADPAIQQPRPRRWPRGFRFNPLRLLGSAQTWRTFAWSLVLGIIAVPLWIFSLVMLPWVPLVARVMDKLGRAGARWLGVPAHERTPNRWFDWQQFALLVAHLVLSAVSFFAMSILIFTIGVLIIAPFVLIDKSRNAGLEIGPWCTDWPPTIFAISWGAALILFFVMVYLGWILAGCSAYTTVASNETGDAQLRRLETSRNVLIDAFTGERRRIERELHDGAQHYLTALQVNIATARVVGQDSGDKALSEALDAAATNAKQASDALRSTVRGIYPQVLKDHGLSAALDELAGHSGINAQLRRFEHGATENTPPVSTTAALLLYHCAAEALTNAVRHGHADQVEIHIEFLPSAVILRIDDDGSGLPDKPAVGTGIDGLRERAAALSGTLFLSPSVRLSGAQLVMEVPR